MDVDGRLRTYGKRQPAISINCYKNIVIPHHKLQFDFRGSGTSKSIYDWVYKNVSLLTLR